MTLCPKDATSNKYYFTSTAEWTAFSGGITTAVLNNLYGLQEASTPSVDSINGANLANGLNFQVAVTGWTLKGTGGLDTSGAQAFNSAHASYPDLNTTSMTSIALVTITNTPAAERSVFMHGAGGTEINNIVLEYNSSNHYVITDGTNTGTGVTNHGTGVVPITLRHNVTASTQAVFIDYTSPEKISKTFALPASGGASKGVWLGDAYFVTPTITILMYAVLKGSNAELTDAQITALHARFNTGAVTSIAVTPVSPSVVGTGTVQLTATATFQDGSTQDVTNDPNVAWNSATPSVGTVSATGLFTGVAAGTSSVTAAYGGVTSGGDTVTVLSGVVPTSITVSPVVFNLQTTKTLLVTATAVLSGTPTNYNATATWTSSNPAIATVAAGVVTGVSPGTVTITSAYPGGGVPNATATGYVHLDWSPDENEHHPWPGVARGIWDYNGSQVVWTGDRVLVARAGDYALGSSAFWHRNTADPSLMKRGLPAYLPLMTDVVPAVNGNGNANGFVESLLTSTLRIIINMSGTSGAIDTFDRTTGALRNHFTFTGTQPSTPRLCISGDKIIATWMSGSATGDLMITVWNGDGWSTPAVLVTAVNTYECCQTIDGVHFVWAQSATGVYIGKLQGSAAVSYPYAWGTNLTNTASVRSVAIGVAPDTSVCVAFGTASTLNVLTYPSSPAVGNFDGLSVYVDTFDPYRGLSVCSRGLKNSAGHYEWLIHYCNNGGPACIGCTGPDGVKALIEKRYNTDYVSKSFRVGDEVFIWAIETNSSALYLLGGQYKAQTCGFADREVGYEAPEDGSTAWLHQVLPDPIVSGDKTGPFTITKVAGSAGAWDAAASSVQTIAGDGYVEYAATAPASQYVMLGLAATNPDNDWTHINYGWYLDGTANHAVVAELGNGAVFDSGVYAAGDVFRVARTATTVRYYKNGTLVYTSLTASSGPLMVDSSFFRYTTLTNVSFVDAGKPVAVTWVTANVTVYSQSSGYGPTKTGTAFSWARQFNTGTPYPRAGNIRIGDMEFLPKLSTTAYGKGVYVSGSAVRCWDGVELGDAGFQSYPTYTGIAGGVGSLSAGNYLARVYAVRYTKQGERFESAALTGFPIAATGGQHITLTIKTLPCTNHQDVVYEVYRTEAGGTTFYLDGFVANDLTTNTVPYVCSMSDALLRTQVADPHATGVGQVSELESWGPLGCAILTSEGDRVWGAGGQVPPGQVQFSKLHNDLYGAGFDDTAGFQDIDTELGAITSLSRLNDTLVAFEANKIFVVAGSGPNNFGDGSFGVPQIVLADGAINHQGTVLTQVGLAYWGIGGPRLLTANYQVSNISVAINLLTGTLTPSAVRADFERQEVVWYTANGTAVLWNYLGEESRWARWSNLNVAAASPSALVMTNGKLYYPTNNANGDGGSGYEFKLKTGLLQAEKVIGGGTLFRSVGLTGQFLGPHTVRARLFYDGSPLWEEEWEWQPQTGTYLTLGTSCATLTPAQIDALKMIDQSGTYITHKRTARNMSAYLQVEISDRGVPNPSFVPTEITLEVGVAPTLARVSPATFKG